MKVVINTNIQKNNELIRMIGRSAASADSIMLNPLKTEFNVLLCQHSVRTLQRTQYASVRVHSLNAV